MGNTHKARIARLPIKERCANTQARGSPVTTASAVLVSEVRKESLTALVDTSLRSEVKMPLQGTRAMSEKMGRAINAPHSAARTTNPLGPERERALTYWRSISWEGKPQFSEYQFSRAATHKGQICISSIFPIFCDSC